MKQNFELATEIIRLTPDICNFYLTENGFLMIDTQLESSVTFEHSHGHPIHHGGAGSSPVPFHRNGDCKSFEDSDKTQSLKGKRRAYLRRSFPFDTPYEYISVADDNGEIGIIFNINDFGEDCQILKNELDCTYFAPKIKKILSVKERFGYSYWKVKCHCGDFEFTVKDTFKSIIRVGENRIFILDVDSSRFEIENLSELDKNSYRKIELYL